ncbi:MAG: SPOR domain-containing protein [Vicinamibacteria bacterium]
MAQDDYYYEIQLTNKQLIFYFMAGAAGLVLSFLAGVMVGRGVEGSAAAAGAEPATRVAEEKVVTEQTPAPAPTEYSYPQRLEADRPAEGLERPAPAAGAPGLARPTPAPVATPLPATPAPVRATPAAAARPTPAPVLPTPPPRATAPTPAPTPAAAATAGLPKALGPTAKGFAVQVGAFKDKASADQIVRSLKSRGLPAFSVAPAARSGGLFTVRVGAYRDRADAEVVVERLRGDKFQPYVIKQ